MLQFFYHNLVARPPIQNKNNKLSIQTPLKKEIWSNINHYFSSLICQMKTPLLISQNSILYTGKSCSVTFGLLIWNFQIRIVV